MDSKTLVALVALLLALVGGTVKAVDYFAKQGDLVELAMDFQQERNFNRMDRLEERMWTIKSKYQEFVPATGEVVDIPIVRWSECDRDEYQKLGKDLRRLKADFSGPKSEGE